MTSDPFAVSWGPGRVDDLLEGRICSCGICPGTRGGPAGNRRGSQLHSGADPFTISVPVYRQAMNLDCETASLQMALAYLGHNFTQQQLFAYENPGHGAAGGEWRPHPSMGRPVHQFRWQCQRHRPISATGYDVYYPVILSIAQSQGSPAATGGEGLSASSIYEAVASGHPVATWVEVGWFRPAVDYWTAWDGRSIRYTLDEHTVVLTGLTVTQVRVNDPRHGTQYWVSRGIFQSSWADFDNMAILFQ